MIAKEFYTKLVGIYLQNKEKELVIGFSEQWKGINAIVFEEETDKLLVVAKDLSDYIYSNTKTILVVLKDVKLLNDKADLSKEIVVYDKGKYHKIIDIHIDIDDCIVIDIEE